jgi:hypothetical protein
LEKSEKVVKPVERDALEPIDSERLTLFEEANVFVDGAFALSVDSRRASTCKPNSPASMLSFSSSASSLPPKSRPRTFFAYEASKSSRGRGSGRSSVAALDSMLVVAVFLLFLGLTSSAVVVLVAASLMLEVVVGSRTRCSICELRVS